MLLSNSTMAGPATKNNTRRILPQLRFRCPKERKQPLWLNPPVPNGFWDSISNRRSYVRWLGQQLGFRRLEDWYQISTDDFKKNSGGTPLATQWKDSAIAAVKEAFPNYDWKEWSFHVAPRSFWRDSANRRRYMEWLGKQLGYRTPADWYQVTNQDFEDHKGRAFLIHYHSTVSAAVMDFLPAHDWKEWLFAKTPKEFWHASKNRRRYMNWLANRLGFLRPGDWYGVSADDFIANHGRELLRLYGGSPMAVVMDCYPRRNWHEWKFSRVPAGFWENPENRRRYVAWLGKRLGVKGRKDWESVGRADICGNYGGALLARYRSYSELLTECVPRLSDPVRDDRPST